MPRGAGKSVAGRSVRGSPARGKGKRTSAVSLSAGQSTNVAAGKAVQSSSRVAKAPKTVLQEAEDANYVGKVKKLAVVARPGEVLSCVPCGASSKGHFSKRVRFKFPVPGLALNTDLHVPCVAAVQ